MPTSATADSGSSTVLDTLIEKLDAAQAAFNHKQPVIAVQLLDKFVHEVQVHAGTRIDFNVANNLKSHAQVIIDSILLMGLRPRANPQQTAACPAALDAEAVAVALEHEVTAHF